MPNGQFHGRTKGHGIRIKNPLRLTVEVTILDAQFQKNPMTGFSTCRTLRPGAEVYVKVPQPGEYDIKTSIIRYDETGQTIRLGDADWEPVATAGAPPRMTPKAGPVLQSGQKELKSRRWVTVAEWLIPKGFAGELKGITLQLDGDCEAQIILPNSKPTSIDKDIAVSYQQGTWVNKGEAVRVKARSRLGNGGTANVMIQGTLYPVGTQVPGKVSKRAPEQVTEKKPRKEPEEPPLRSLGDMIEEMRKEEEVKV